MADYSDQTVRISELATDSDLLEGLSFENCVIVGPAVLVPMGCKFDDASFEGNAVDIIWDIDPAREHIIGAIGLKECTFERCQFTRIGLGFGPQGKADYLNALEETEARQKANEPVAG